MYLSESLFVCNECDELCVQVMKEWTAARQHVEELKKTNPKGAEKLESEVTEVCIKNTYVYTFC